MAGDTRAQMIRTAARMFQRHGYHATSWRSLVDEAGTPWGSIHHHFPGGKDELAVAAVDASAQAVRELIDHCFENPDPAAAVDLWFTTSTKAMVEGNYSVGCPIATIALETVSTPGIVRDATRRAFALWETALTSHFRKHAVRQPKTTATSILALFEGALMLSRTAATTNPMTVAGRQARQLVAIANDQQRRTPQGR